MLLHMCCAPCSIYPLGELRRNGFDVVGFFYNQNIHPYQECQRRQEALSIYAEHENLKIIYQEGYNIETFFQRLDFGESASESGSKSNRCLLCYQDRMATAAQIAKRGQFDFFTSTLLQSKFQKHDLIKAAGEDQAAANGVRFLYQDFRIGWKEGVETSKRLGMYRQQYCGCVFSEKERFFKIS